MLTVREFEKGINPHGIPYADMKKGKFVIVDIPIDHHGNCVEVEGIISRNIWCSSPNCFSSQIEMTKQNTKKDNFSFDKGLYAIYPENIKKMI